MVMKLIVGVLFLGAAICVIMPAYSQDDTEKLYDASMDISKDEEIMPAEEGVGEGVVTGDVTALDAAAGSITIKSADGAEKSFSIVEGETILWKGIEDIKTADIKKGDKAEVGYYTDDAGKLIASWVDVIVPEQPAAAGNAQISPPASMEEPSAMSDE